MPTPDERKVHRADFERIDEEEEIELEDEIDDLLLAPAANDRVADIADHARAAVEAAELSPDGLQAMTTARARTPYAPHPAARPARLISTADEDEEVGAPLAPPGDDDDDVASAGTLRAGLWSLAQAPAPSPRPPGWAESSWVAAR